MSTTIAERIVMIREGLSLSQEDLAPRLGMSRSNLSGIELGRISPTLSTICAVCLLFDIYVDWLVLGIGENPDLQEINKAFNIWCQIKFNNPLSEVIDEKDIKEFIKSFSIRLKTYRKQQKLSQKEVMSKTGIPQTSYTRIEKATSSLSAEVLEKILVGLNLSGDWLLFGIEPHQKARLFPSDIFSCENNSEKIEKLYQEKLHEEMGRRSPKIYDFSEIQKKGAIPFTNLTDDQLKIISDLIFEFEGKNIENGVGIQPLDIREMIPKKN